LKADLFAGPGTTDRFAICDGESRVFKSARQLVNVLPKEALEESRIDPLITALDSFQDKQSTRFQNPKHFFRDAFEVEGMVE